MRRVRRPRKPPASLAAGDTVAGRELVAARDFYKKRANKGRTFAFKAYKGDDVREALRAMFDGKCAYCETVYDAAMPEDVEHYRPKAAVVDAGATLPGYWWLAMVWTNLLPSCIDCNRARKQVLDGAGERVTAGKANQFPLAAGTKRATKEGGERSEEPLLLDPTVDDPRRHLEFLPDGTIRPRLSRGAESARGRATIDVLALHRRGLAKRREEQARTTEVAIQHVRDTMALIARMSTLAGVAPADRKALLADLRTQLDRDIADMEQKAKSTTTYSAVAEAMVRAFKSESGL